MIGTGSREVVLPADPGQRPTVVAWVAGVALTLDVVDRQLAELRRGPFSSRLPAVDTAEGRNMRRWVVQLCVSEMLVEHECQRRGLTPASAPARRPDLDLKVALSVGGVTAAVLTRSPGARALAAEMAAEAVVPDDVARQYYERNLDLFAHGDQSYAAAAAVIRAELAEAERNRVFASWLESAARELVVLEAGYEHPAEPGHPDATHHH
jgi:[acyl-carrier-protein] S-malonyltransferase